MSKGFLGLNVLLAIVSVLFAVQIGRGVIAPYPAPDTGPRKAGSPAAGAVALPPDVATEARPPVASYAAIAAKSLFNPTRSEGAATAAPVQPVGPKPFLYGIVLGDDLSIAYLEDPVNRRVAGYRIGDAIAGGTLEVITPDHVVLKRADGAVDVALRDPLKPRAVVAGPGVLPQQQLAPMPPVPRAGITRPPAPPQAYLPPTGALPPSPALLRRLPPPPILSPPPAGRDAPSR